MGAATAEAAASVLAELTRHHEPGLPGGHQGQAEAQAHSHMDVHMNAQMNAHIEAQVQTWQSDTRQAMATQWPHQALLAKLDDWEACLSQSAVSPQALAQAVQAYVEVCSLAEQPANEHFWREQWQGVPQGDAVPATTAEGLRAAGELLALEWRKALDKLHSQWALQTIHKRRTELLKRLKEQLALMGSLGEPLEELGLDPGVLVDLSRGRWSAQEMSEFRRWAQYLADDAGLKALCERLGRLRSPASTGRVQRVSTQHQEVWQTQTSAREEMIGIRLGRDLEHALPAELALLSDPDTSLLFDLKYVESRLMCFDMIGMQRVKAQQDALDEVRVAEVNPTGPMVICVDSSGSMEGMPETVAKAVVLFLAAKAREQRRACYLLNFSTSLQTLDLSQPRGMAMLMEFLQMSFHGGTDVAPALRHAIDTMQEEAFENADLLVISDFVMGRLHKAVLDEVEGQRSKGGRFHALLIGSHDMPDQQPGLFDHTWVHDPQIGGVRELPATKSALQV